MAALSKTISMCGGCLDRTWLLVGYADLAYAFRGLFGSYRPERYYMRGPGPKWHAKHDRKPASIRCDC
jgi:hypothetical protein